MRYTELYQYLSENFNPGKESIDLPATSIKIKKKSFASPSIEEDFEEFGGMKGIDTFIGYNSLAYRNQNFDYHIFQPNNTTARKGAIILLHGLNERSWEKYLAWANILCNKTGKSVILFPIAFHMNRSPEAWQDSRQMKRYVEARKKAKTESDYLTFANIAISERLTYAPEQFFFSGYQSAKDVHLLSKQIINGENDLFDKDASIDFFGYSFGAFLEEILLIANPDNIYDNSKFFFFCGGCAFSEMQGASKYIMDKRAFERIQHFYIHDLKIELERSTVLSKLLNDTVFGRAFVSLCSLDSFKNLPKDVQDRFEKSITVLGLEHDEIIPKNALELTLPKVNKKFLKYEYQPTHEVPFPVSENGIREQVDSAFDEVFEIAAKELSH